MTLGEGKDKVIKLINDYSISGEITPATDPNRLDYSLRFNSLFDMAQKEAAAIKKINRKKSISQNMPSNVLGNYEKNFDIVPYSGTEIIYAGEAKAYYFEVDDEATIYIEEQDGDDWEIIDTIVHEAPIGEFSAYKGLVDATGNIRLRFAGSTAYNIRNVALFNSAFSSSDRIPDYGPFVLYDMPTDFYQLNRVVLNGNAAWRQNPASFYWEDPTTIAVRYTDVGEYSIFYYAYPQTISDTTLDTYTFEVSEDTAQALPYFVAAHLLMSEVGQNNASNKLLALYQNRLQNLDTKIANDRQYVTNTMFGYKSPRKLF